MEYRATTTSLVSIKPRPASLWNKGTEPNHNNVRLWWSCYPPPSKWFCLQNSPSPQLAVNHGWKTQSTLDMKRWFQAFFYWAIRPWVEYEHVSLIPVSVLIIATIGANSWFMKNGNNSEGYANFHAVILTQSVYIDIWLNKWKWKIGEVCYVRLASNKTSLVLKIII